MSKIHVHDSSLIMDKCEKDNCAAYEASHAALMYCHAY